jgi:acetamidase/formamidase
MRRFDRSQTTLFFDSEAEPIAELDDGERVIVETADAICGLAKSLSPGGAYIDDIVDHIGGACPVTGPFFVRGTSVGDVLEVDFHRVDADPPEGEGWTGVFGGFGAFDHERYSLSSGPTPEIRMVPYADGIARLPNAMGETKIPMAPFLVTVVVAPVRERRMTFSQSPEYLGDVDIPALTAGATLVLPVNVEGALLGLGDAHGAQGSGEITGAAIEIKTEVEMTVRSRDRTEANYMGLPQINNAYRIGSVAGFEGVSLGDCARAAYRDLVLRLEAGYGLSQVEAYELLSQVGRLDVGNMIDPFYSVMASIERQFLR